MTRNRSILKAGIAITVIIVLGWAVSAARKFYYAAADVGGKGPPSPLLEHPEQTGIQRLSNVSFTSPEGTLIRAWYVPPKNGAAVVITGGTDANRSAMLPEVRIISAAGFGVLALDWPGTGLSEGKIDWGSGAPAALKGAVDWLAQRPEVIPSKIGAMGFSAGGAITLRVAADDQRVHSVLLTGTSPATNESPSWFHRSAHPLKVLPAEWAARYYGWPVGRLRPFDLIGRLAPRPVMIIGGTDDPNASPAMTEQLLGAARDPKSMWIVPGGTHGTYAQAAPQEYARRLTDFLRRTLIEN